MEDDPLIKDVWAEMAEKYKKKVYNIVEFMSLPTRKYRESLSWIYDLSEAEKTVVYYLIGVAAKNPKSVLDELYLIRCEQIGN